MESEELERYLDRFYQGETTAEEELVLQDFLLSGQAGEEWSADTELFAAMRAAREEARRKDGETVSDADVARSRLRLEESIAAWADSGSRAGTERNSGKGRIFYRLLGGMAAAVVLAVGIGLYRIGNPSPETPDSGILCQDGDFSGGPESLALVDTYTDPVQARAAAEDVLKKFAEVLQKSKSDLGNAGEKTRKWRAKMDRALDF